MNNAHCFGWALLLGAAASGQQPIVTTVLSNGPSADRYDMVILGDGYVASEQNTFNTDVSTFLTGLFQKQPYATFASYFNVHTVFRASAQSGATHPAATPPIIRNTAYGSAYNTGGTPRCLYITNTSLALQDAALAPANESRVIVIVNDSRYGGCAGQFAVSYNGTSMVETHSHEFGHALGLLADEYDYPQGHYSGSEPDEVNITADGIGQKWSHWWGTEGVSAFEGAGYHATGLWRPRTNCLMRNLGAANCAVCREQLARQLNARTNVIGSPSPASSTVTILQPAAQLFWFQNAVPPANGPVITWRLDGQVLPGQTSPAYFLQSGTLNPGTHTLSVTVEDPTGLVRSDPSGTMTDVHNWTVVIQDPNSVDLQLANSIFTPIQVDRAGSINSALTLTNHGPGTANNVVVEHFLSVDGIVQTSDIYLGATTVPTLAPGQTQLTRTLQVPALIDPRTYLLIAIVDRQGSIAETNEVNNLAIRIATVQQGACLTALEYRDDMLYPRDHAELPVGAGGSVQPTVVADCFGPNTLYLIAWGCSGTQPGTPLAPGVIAPLNSDACTDLALAALNGNTFQSFWGLLDSAGVGRATLNWPATLSIAPLQSHFAAVLLDPVSGQFTGTTNAVSFDLN